MKKSLYFKIRNLIGVSIVFLGFVTLVSIASFDVYNLFKNINYRKSNISLWFIKTIQYNYGIGNLVELRRNLNYFVTAESIVYGSFKNTDDQIIWEYYSDNYTIVKEVVVNKNKYFNNFILNPILNVHQNIEDENSNILGSITFSISLENDLYSIYFRFGMILFFFTVLTIIMVRIGFIYNRRIFEPLIDLISKIEKKIEDLNGHRMELANSADEVEKLSYSFNELNEAWLFTKKELAKKEALATIGQSTSHIAHDMRSPLSVLKTFIQFAKCGEDKDSLELEQSAKNSVKRLNDMADEMLDYSKATKIEKTKININEVINDSVQSAKVNAEMKGVLVIYTKELEDAKINADSYRIGRVMTNIINNAVQAMDGLPSDVRDAKRVNEVVVTTNIEEQNLVIKIRDNGKGISKEHLPKIFEPFFTKGKKGGTGLGLSYCKQVIEAHGGEITVESEVGKGTEFRIKLPV